MGLSIDDSLDLVSATLNAVDKGKWTDLTGDLQEYYAMPRILKKQQVRFQSGLKIEGRVMVRDGGQARVKKMYAIDDTDRVDLMEKMFIPWRLAETSWTIDKTELSLNRSENRIFELIKEQRIGAFVSLAKLLEHMFWGKPASAADDMTWWGIGMCIVKNSTEGFHGGDPAGFPSGYGELSSVDYPRFQNYSGSYVAISKADLVKKMRTMYRKIQFRSPINMPSNQRGSSNYGIFTNENVYSGYEALVEGQNENMGDDIGGRAPKFKGNRVNWVPSLDSDATDPVYFINWASFYPVFLSGEYMVEGPPRKAPMQHTVIETFIDLTGNFRCTDRRSQGVLSK